MRSRALILPCISFGITGCNKPTPGQFAQQIAFNRHIVCRASPAARQGPLVLTSIVAFFFVLGVLISVHELGHFLMARRIGVRVLTFSLGFGPKLIAFRRGDTEYCISAVPLGGYVKMAGEKPNDARTGASEEFLSKSKWQRFQVLIMGPVMNLVLAVVVMAAVLYHGAPALAFMRQPPLVGKVLDKSVTKPAGLRAGDLILSVDDTRVPTWEEFLNTIAVKSKRHVTVTVERAGKQQDITFVPVGTGRYDIVDIDNLDILPVLHPQVKSLQPEGPAVGAGLKPGDVIMAAAGERDVTNKRLMEIISVNEGKSITIELKRDGEILQVPVEPRNINGTVILGADLSAFEIQTIQPGIWRALKMSLHQNWAWAKMIGQTVGGLFTHHTSVKQLMGPIAIADLSGMAAAQGMLQLFSLMAMVSLNLGLINLMPIPVLDGGHIAILALEGVSKRDFSIKVKEKMLVAGFVVLLMLIVTVIYNDLTRIQWVERLMPWR
jgi:regulator of sigma E protease